MLYLNRKYKYCYLGKVKGGGIFLLKSKMRKGKCYVAET